jgi:hypothetical protein
MENIVVLRNRGALVVEDGLSGVSRPETHFPELDRELTGARRDAERTRAEAHLLDQRVRAREQVLADVFNSASWQLTKPLRTAKHSVALLLG